MEPHEQLQAEMAIDQMIKNMPLTIKQARICAETMFEYYQALQEKGFTKKRR